MTAGPYPWRFAAQGVVIAVRVTPRGGRDAIDGIETMADGRSVLHVRVRVIAEGGAANRAASELLAKSLGVAKGSVRVVSGVTSRIKRIAVDGEPAVLGERLQILGTASAD